MFSVFPTPFTSFAPIPPTPMQAMLSLSLGARYPRPSTWRGTMVNATPAPTSPTNFRLEMRFRAMTRPSSIGRHRLARRRGVGAEQRGEEHQDDRSEHGGEQPEAQPLLPGEARGCAQESIVDLAGDPGADEHADAVRHQHPEPLRLAAERSRGPLGDGA